MKTFAKYLLFCCAALAFWACGTHTFDESGNLKPGPSPASSSSGIAFNVQYTLASEFSDEPHITTVIFSKNEIEEYYKNQWIKICDEQGNVGWKNGFGWDQSCNTIEKYSDDYFADNFLVIIDNIWEPSGSFRHRVERIDENGDIVISRLMSSPYTTDIGDWGIIIELNNRFKAEQFKAVFVDVWLDS